MWTDMTKLIVRLKTGSLVTRSTKLQNDDGDDDTDDY